MRVAVKQVLMRNGVKREDFDKNVSFVMEPSEAAYQNGPLVA